jgi:hypothetical protein
LKQNRILKTDSFGSIELRVSAQQSLLLRNTKGARASVRLIARHLARREARALIALGGVEGIPELIEWNGSVLARQWLGGKTMREQPPANSDYFRAALRLLRIVHSRGVAHNDLAKEANCLMLENNQPGFIDFQLAWYSPRRGRIFRLMAREDLRHLLKHKRYYCPDSLTARQHRILADKSLPSRVWMRFGKPVYHWLTRSILGRADREGAGNRH